MLRVKKGNVIYDVTEVRLEQYLKEGYDQIDPKTGKVIRQATGGKTYTIEEYRALEDENARLKEEIASLKKGKSK